MGLEIWVDCSPGLEPQGLGGLRKLCCRGVRRFRGRFKPLGALGLKRRWFSDKLVLRQSSPDLWVLEKKLLAQGLDIQSLKLRYFLYR